jgi:hypothetical protein
MDIDLKINAFPQATSFTCGPAITRTLLSFLKMPTPSETELSIALDTRAPASPRGPGGTRPEAIANHLIARGLRVTWGEGGTIEWLLRNLEQRIPTIGLYLSEGEGHWGMVSGFRAPPDQEPVIVLASPSDDPKIPGREELTLSEFERLWFDDSSSERRFDRLYITARP